MTFVYKPIQPGQVRLVRFAHHGDHISAGLRAFSLDGQTPFYNALSYTWLDGNTGPPRNHVLQVEGQRLPVLDSLQPFFHALRANAPLFDRVWWWIDSICIDLENPQERAHQVQLMGSIYHNARQTICWLGELSDATSLAFDFMEILSEAQKQRTYLQIRSMFQQDRYQPHWAALTSFFQWKWWTRIWTVQEYAIPAGSLLFWHGTRSVDRATVVGALRAANLCTTHPFKETLAFRHAWNRKRLQLLQELGSRPPEAHTFRGMSLTALAAYTSCFEATDDRDRLYGVRGLANDARFLKVDYSLSVEEVYFRFVKSFIHHYKSLDVICFASIYGPPPGSSLPSWVPDWRTKVDPLVVPLMVSQSARTHIGNVRPQSQWGVVEPSALFACYAASMNIAAVYRFEGSALLARGAVLDTVGGLAGSRNTELVQGTSESDSSDPRPSSMDPTADSLSEILNSVCKCLVMDRKDRYLRMHMPAGDYLREFVWFCAQLMRTETTTSPVPKEFHEWFARTKSLRIQGQSLESILRHSKEMADVATPSLPSDAPNQDEDIQDTFFNRFFDNVVRMSLRLMVTHNGHIGLTTEKAMKGDLVCVLLGCSVPVLLRRKSENEHTWTFIGECFLDGFMNGECLKQASFVERTFHII